MHKKPLLIIEWDDISAYSNWIDENEDISKTEPIHCISVGWKLKANRKYLVIASTRSGEGRCTDREAIPRGCIRSIRRIE